jgi:hypothetical protein
MAESIVHHRRLMLVALAAIVLTGALFLIWAGQPVRASGALTTTPTAGAPVVESVLVARRAGDHDALWLLSPLGGTPTAAGELPGAAGSVAVSPDGANVAYLPANGGPRVWVGYGPLGPKTISLAGAGVRRVDSLTWIDDHRLLVSGATGASAGYYQDRLFLVNVTTGKTASFRDLRGTEPSAAPAVGKVVYVRLTVVRPGTAANGNTPTIRESLRVVRVAGGTGRTVLAETYRLFADHRSFARPRLSPDGKWLLTGQTGSDVSVTYAVRDSGIGYPLLTISTGALLSQSGWNAAGRAAFGGTPNLTTMDEACVWVYDADGGTLARTPAGLLPHMMVTDLAWSAAGDLAAGARSWNVSPQTRHVFALPGDLTTAIDLGTGRLPVWVIQ